MDDREVLTQVPESLQSLLTSLNGFVQFGGGLHVRGACWEPEWHSLRRAWRGPGAIHKLFPSVSPDWIPFAEDCVGDQFLLRNSEVLRLSAETADIEEMGLSLENFLKEANADPVEFLSMHPLLQLTEETEDLPEGYLIHAYPPFCTEEAAQGVSLKAIPAWELHQHHSDLAKTFSVEDDKRRLDAD